MVEVTKKVKVTYKIEAGRYINGCETLPLSVFQDHDGDWRLEAGANATGISMSLAQVAALADVFAEIAKAGDA